MKSENKNVMYQVSTLQALLLGYFKGVVTVEELTHHGSIGLGTFENVNGEMIVLDGHVYQADNRGRVVEADPDKGVPFAAVASVPEEKAFSIRDITSIDQLRQVLNNAIEEDFGLNSMYVIRIDGLFQRVMARSEEGQRSQHVELSEVLQKNQKDFTFENLTGTMVCMYFPDYMDGINAPGWHLHFISDDRKCGGHVFDLAFREADARRAQMHNISIQLPFDAAFDTYSLKQVSADEVKKVEQSAE